MSLPAIAYEPFWLVRHFEAGMCLMDAGANEATAAAAMVADAEKLLGPLLQRARRMAAADRERLQVQGEPSAADTRRLVDAYGVEFRISDDGEDHLNLALAIPERKGRPAMILAPSSFTSDVKEAEALAELVGHLEVGKLPAFALERTTSRPVYDGVRDLCQQVARAYAAAWLGRELPE